jgi:hypothetical protein
MPTSAHVLLTRAKFVDIRIVDSGHTNLDALSLRAGHQSRSTCTSTWGRLLHLKIWFRPSVRPWRRGAVVPMLVRPISERHQAVT